MTQQLSAEEIAEFREIFNLVDRWIDIYLLFYLFYPHNLYFVFGRDGGGSITKEELGELMDTLGIDATPEEIDIMIREVNLPPIIYYLYLIV